MMKKVIIILLIVLTSCTMTSNVVLEQSEANVYFCPRDMCQEKMLDLIRESTDIKCAFYELNLPEMIEALKEKDAQVIIEDSTYEGEFMTGHSKALMHNKFCIFDSKIVTTGSMNPTENCNYKNNNNLIIIKSKSLSKNYLQEFEELKNGEYGKGQRVKNQLQSIQNYFCPEDDCKMHVLDELKKAKTSIYFIVFSFTDQDISNLLWNYYHQGIDVKGVMEEKQISRYSMYDELKKFAMLDRNPYNMHHKVFIIDNETVISGSYNPTRNGDEYNDENIIIIHDKSIAKRFLEEFRYVYLGEIQTTNSIIINKVVYDVPGKDEGNEFVELKNVGDSEVVLEYYFLSDNKTNSRLEGNIKSGEIKRVAPRFALKNSEGVLILKKSHEPVDYVYWAGKWDLEAKEKSLIRSDESISESSWSIANI